MMFFFIRITLKVSKYYYIDRFTFYLSKYVFTNGHTVIKVEYYAYTYTKKYRCLKYVRNGQLKIIRGPIFRTLKSSGLARKLRKQNKKSIKFKKL